MVPLSATSKQSLLVGGRAREGSLHITEQFAFQQRVGKRPAIHRNKRRVGARAVDVDGLGDEFLSSSAFSGDQDGAVGSADNFDHLEELLHLLTLANQIAHPVNLAKLAAKVGVFFAEPAILQRAVDNQLQLFDEILGFDDVVECAHLQGLDGGLRTGKGRQQNEMAVEIVVSQLPQQIDSGHIGHVDVGYDQIKFDRLAAFKPFFCVLGDGDRKAFLLQDNFQQFADGPLVVDNKNLWLVSIISSGR